MSPSYREEPAKIVGLSALIPVTLVTDTGAYADNDVLVVAQEITNVFRVPTGRAIIQSLVLIDLSDQAQDIDILFFSENVTLGTINSAVTISDADAAKYLGAVQVVAADYVDLVNSQSATKSGVGLVIEAAANSTSLWVAAVLRSGTPTYAADALRLKLGLLKD